MARTRIPLEKVDVFELNEAFAAQSMAVIKDLKIPTEKINPFGGAIALGHPIGASGTRIVVTLINALDQLDGKIGVASLCEAAAWVLPSRLNAKSKKNNKRLPKIHL